MEYLATCAECVDASPVGFETPEQRAEWMAAHTEASEHDAWYLAEERV